MATLEGEAKGRDKELVSDGQEMRPDWQYLMSECPLLTEFAISSQQYKRTSCRLRHSI